MKKLFVASMLVFASTWAVAQQVRTTIEEQLKDKTIAADTAKKGAWKAGGTLGINFLQQNASNWVGVTERFSQNLGINGDLYANTAWGKNSWVNTFKAAYGLQKTQSLGRRKTLDFFDLFSKYGHNLKKGLDFATIFDLRSQFSNGYVYTANTKTKTSGFMAPGTVLLTPGLDWKPKPYFSLFFSPLAARWVIVNDEALRSAYGIKAGKKADSQFGAFASANFDKDIFKNVRYSSRLDLFSNYRHNPQNIDIFWTNNLAFKVNSWLNLSYLWNIAYDDDYSVKRPQFLGTFGIGVGAKF